MKYPIKIEAFGLCESAKTRFWIENEYDAVIQFYAMYGFMLSQREKYFTMKVRSYGGECHYMGCIVGGNQPYIIPETYEQWVNDYGSNEMSWDDNKCYVVHPECIALFRKYWKRL